MSKLKHAKKIAALAMCLSMALPSIGGGYSALGADNTFTDISGHWAERVIEQLVDEGAISGYGDNTFKPDNTITRAEFVTVVNRFFGFTDADAEQFDDVSADAWYAQQMLIARKAGYFSGSGNNMANPEANITRQDAFAIIARLYNFTERAELDFTDESEISSYARDAFELLTAAGVISGYSDGTIRPTAFLTRAETASILVRVDSLGSAQTGEPSDETATEDEETTTDNEETKTDKEESTTSGSTGSSGGGGGGGGGSSSSSDDEEDSNRAVAELVSLDVIDSTTKDIFDETTFRKGTSNYSVTVQSDIYGVLIKAEGEEGTTIKVTADKDTYSYGATEPDYVAGTEISYNSELGGYLVYLDQSYDGYDGEFIQTVTIQVSKSGQTTKTYKVTVTREDDTEIYEKFTEGEFDYTSAEGEITLKYNYYEPENIAEGEKLPVILVLHGSGQSGPSVDENGQRSEGQPLDMILKRYQMATIWAKDSESDPSKRAIVIAPQMSALNNLNGISGWGGGTNELSTSGEAAYALLQSVLQNDYADANRVYVLGCSMGGMGTFSMLSTHPETFAAAIPVCARVSDDYNYEALEELSGKIYITHAEEDPSVDFENFGIITENLDKLGIDYESKTWTANEVFWPHSHFSWVPTFADESIRDWLFAQTKDGNEASLKSLDLVDITTDNIFDETKFAPGRTNYDVTVQSDIYGVLLKVEAAEGSQIKVTAGSTTYQADTWGNITPDYEAGTEIPYQKVEGDGGYEGYIIPLDQSYEGYDSEFVQPVYITVTNGDVTTTYNVTITRESLKDIYDLFTESEYTATNGETIPYELYVPSDYQEGEQLPIVFALHGSGQRVQPTFMVLKRYQMATAWAKDSEEGTNRCIVLAPQCNTDENGRNWTDLMRTDITPDAYNPDPKLIAAYELLEKTIDDYNVDTSRVYMTGLSAGGYATFAMALAHPETFAAILPVAGGVDTEADLSVLGDMGIWVVQATNDPLVSYEDVYVPTMEALENAGLEVNTTLYENSEVFYPSGHFSWTPAYADEEIRNWLFSNVKAGGGADTEGVAELTALDVIDVTTKNIFDENTFRRATTDYDVTVQSDIYGVLLKVTGEEGTTIKVTADTDTYTYGNFGNKALDYEAGTEIKYDDDLDGYLVKLDQSYGGYDSEFVQTVSVEVSKNGEETTTYTVQITREDDTWIYDEFTQETYTTTDGAFELDYNVYYPDGYETSGKKYPVVFALHGNGQSDFGPDDPLRQPIDMILKRYQMATVWAKDSEMDTSKECIVVAPQVDKLASEYWGLGNNLETCGLAAYELLENEFLNKEYVDTDRIYVTGLSLGGMGTYSMLVNHPDTFAGAIAVCGMVTDDYDYSALEPMSGRIYITHAEGDQSVDFENFEKITDGLRNAGIEFESKTWTANEVFYPQPHFSWTPTYADEDIRAWLFNQSK